MPPPPPATGDTARTSAGPSLARRFRRRYGITMALLVVLVAAALLTSARLLDSQRGAAAEIRTAGELEVALQRVAVLVSELDHEDDEATAASLRSELRGQVRHLEARLTALLDGEPDAGIPPAEGEALQILAAPPTRVRAEVDRVASAARRFAELEAAGDDARAARAAEEVHQAAGLFGLGTDLADSARTLTAAYEEAAAGGVDGFQREVVVLTAVALAGLAALALGVHRPLARRIAAETERLAEAEREQRLEGQRQALRAQLHDAFEMADHEHDVEQVVERALASLTDAPTELLLADSSRAHLRAVVAHPTAGGPSCPVSSPWDCVAVRRGRSTTFTTSTALNACPKLVAHEGGPCSAVCVPVTFMGRALGVLHGTGPDGEAPGAELVERLGAVANEAGARLGTLRAFARSELQASTDGLTGLANRRSLEARVRVLLADGRGFAVVMADLDHFKQLNDTHGHEAGDRALRLFSRVLTQNLRTDDVVARYGGEEFVLVLPDRDALGALEVAERLRTVLSGELAGGELPPFTASYGVADHRAGSTWPEILRAADGALLTAKRTGRDRAVLADGATPLPLGTWGLAEEPEPADEGA